MSQGHSGGLMDAFKNLIRHGKHAKSAAAAPTPSSNSATGTAAHQDKEHKHRQARDQRAQDLANQAELNSAGGVRAAHQDNTSHHGHHHQQNQQRDVVMSPHKEAAEFIVKEENEAKNKMPVYPGLEDFKLISKMGDGAFSNVYKAIDTRTNQKVAVKVVHKYELSTSQKNGNKHLNEKFKKKKPRVTERSNILKEVSIMRGLAHPSVVKLLAFSESEEHFFLVLELMEGGELFHQIVKLTYFSENLARHVILQVAQGIRYLHEERGVVHRDIKPENLLFERIPMIPSKHPQIRQFDEDKVDEGEFVPGRGGGEIGRVKIADFGLSKVVWAEETATPCGTVGYTAPEIVKDERYSKSVDMWALGCVLYTLLCGFPPFYDESINVLTEKVAKGHYTFLEPWWNDISASAKDLITHLLCVDPSARYTIDEFLAHPWCHASAAPAPPPTPAVERARLAQIYNLDYGGAGRASPGVNTLKEAFDVSYAVHRMEEEGANRQRVRNKYGNNTGAAGARGFVMGGLNEVDEEQEEDDERAVVDDARNRRDHRSGKSKGHSAGDSVSSVSSTSTVGGGSDANSTSRGRTNRFDGRAGMRDQGDRAPVTASGTTGARTRKAPANPSAGFNLDLGNATLIGRRHRGGPGSSPLAGTAVGGGRMMVNDGLAPGAGYANVPGSPMRGVEQMG